MALNPTVIRDHKGLITNPRETYIKTQHDEFIIDHKGSKNKFVFHTFQTDKERIVNISFNIS